MTRLAGTHDLPPRGEPAPALASVIVDGRLAEAEDFTGFRLSVWEADLKRLPLPGDEIPVQSPGDKGKPRDKFRANETTVSRCQQAGDPTTSTTMPNPRPNMGGALFPRFRRASPTSSAFVQRFLRRRPICLRLAPLAGAPRRRDCATPWLSTEAGACHRLPSAYRPWSVASCLQRRQSPSTTVTCTRHLHGG